ncbi:MAG TPA: hypothetical protein ENJ95_14165 [Bacteroidetes bacterium]|nr:hypothetical protein [Bacteroidota bacterium]
MKKLFTFFILFIAIQLAAQEKTGIAVLVDKSQITDFYQKKIFGQFVENLKTSKRNNYLIYDWKEKTHSVVYDRVLNENNTDQPVEQLVFVLPTIKYERIPALQLTADSTGKTVSAFYNMVFESDLYYKVIDFRTSEIISTGEVKAAYADMHFPKNKLEVTDFAKYFKGDPYRLKSTNYKIYREGEKRTYLAYKEKINKIYDKAAEHCAKSTATIPAIINGLQDKRVYKIINLDASKVGKKLVELEMDGGDADFISKGDYVYLYENVSFGEKKTTKLLAAATVKGTSENKSALKIIPFQRKKAAKAITEKRDVFLVRNKNVINEINNKNGESYKISLDKNCLFCAHQLEMSLKKLEHIEILERAHMAELKFFTEKFKNEKFIDFDMDDMQGKQQGVQVVLQLQKKGIKATDVKTGRVLEAGTVTYDSKLATLFLDMFDKEIELLEVSGQKKNKINEVIAYHPFGFVAGQKIYAFEVAEEKVGGKVLERNIELGEGRVQRLISDKVAPVKITKGKKDIYAAKNANKKIRLMPEHKTGLLEKLQSGER